MYIHTHICVVKLKDIFEILLYTHNTFKSYQNKPNFCFFVSEFITHNYMAPNYRRSRISHCNPFQETFLVTIVIKTP